MSSKRSCIGKLAYDRLNGTRIIGPSYSSLSYTYDTYLICMGLGPNMLSVIAKSLAYKSTSYASLPVLRVQINRDIFYLYVNHLYTEINSIQR